MSELKSLSKLKNTGKLHYWRGTIEIDEYELHTICDEIQAEYDKAVAAMNKAAGNVAATLGEQPVKLGADALSQRARDMARNIQGNLGRCLYRRKDVAEMEEVSKTLMELANELNSRAERTCKQEERGWGTEGDHARVWLTCGHDCMVPTVQDLPNYCPYCGAFFKEYDESEGDGE